MTRPSEDPSRIEPCGLSGYPDALANLIVEVQSASNALGQLNPLTAGTLADLVRMMNCYYSNLIEGHNTRPRDIERALANDLATSPEARNLQLEAKAHMEVQREIDRLALEGTLPEPASKDFVLWIHRRFYERVPEALRVVGGEGRKLTVVPGQFRTKQEEDVMVGRHEPPPSQSVDSFMDYFSSRFRFASLGGADRIATVAIAHHRFNFIHPFVDGNGRVSRLMSHAMCLHAGIGAHGLWSISRGLARGLQIGEEYKRMMALTDLPREGDLDGRGNLSLSRLRDFVKWFLSVCLDQIHFMTGQFDLDGLRKRLGGYVLERGLPSGVLPILDAVFVRGELPRGDAAIAAGVSPRTAQPLVRALLDDGILTSSTPKGPVRLRFTLDSAELLLPNLFS